MLSFGLSDLQSPQKRGKAAPGSPFPSEKTAGRPQSPPMYSKAKPSSWRQLRQVERFPMLSPHLQILHAEDKDQL